MKILSRKNHTTKHRPLRSTATPVYRTSSGEWTFSCHECEQQRHRYDDAAVTHPKDAKRAARDHRTDVHGVYAHG